MYSLAGSIRIILKPINQQTSFSTTYSDDFAQDLIQLFKAGYDKKSILDFSGLYDKNILKKLLKSFSKVYVVWNTVAMTLPVWQWSTAKVI